MSSGLKFNILTCFSVLKSFVFFFIIFFFKVNFEMPNAIPKGVVETYCYEKIKSFSRYKKKKKGLFSFGKSLFEFNVNS